jgi:integrase
VGIGTGNGTATGRGVRGEKVRRLIRVSKAELSKSKDLGRAEAPVNETDKISCVVDGWRAACKRAAVVKRGSLETVIRPRLLGRTPHDFRRTAARNLIRAGVAQHVVMQLCGWKTDAMFRRYAIVDGRDLRSAVELLARGTIGAQSAVRGLRDVG